MSGGGIARRYVQPLFEVAREKGILDRVQADLTALDKALTGAPELWTLFQNPSAGRKVKRRVADQVFQGMSEYSLNFIRLVLDKNRHEILRTASRLFDGMLNQHKGIRPGLVETAVKVEDATRQRLQSALEKQFGGALQLEWKVNPELLGGVRIRVGNTVLDSSVRGRLEGLRSALAGS